MLYFKKAGRVQNIVHHLKYHHGTDLGIFLGRIMGARLLNNPHYTSADWLVPVPLHKKRLKKRGYNQSYALCLGIADALRIPVSTNNLIRAENTASQTKKSRYTRYENMRSVFQVAEPDQFTGKNVLLVDDVITTGATLEACGNALLKAGAANISIAALAFAD